MKSETINKLSLEARSFIIKAEGRIREIEEEINQIDSDILDLETLEQ